ncbi:MAG: hypothetical protein H2174_01790 [Vampirovibrio sp.]|nr:hypothetical protein [Vampirovibrio sp.]
MPVADKTSVVLATMGFIASLCAVFGVGLLYSKMNHANKGALHEVQTALAQMEKKLDRLEKQLKNRTNGEDLESGLSEMRRLLLEAKSDLFFLYKQSSLQSHQINQLDEKMDKLMVFANYIGNAMNRIQFNARKEAEHQISINFIRGGKEGFIEAYMSKNKEIVPKIEKTLAEIKAKHEQRETLTRNLYPDAPTKPCEPLLLLIQSLSEKEKVNPLILQVLLRETCEVLEEVSNLPNLKSVEPNQITFAVRELKIYKEAIHQYETRTSLFTEEEKQFIKKNPSIEGRIESFVDCRDNHFSIEPETAQLMNELHEFLVKLNGGEATSISLFGK